MQTINNFPVELLMLVVLGLVVIALKTFDILISFIFCRHELSSWWYDKYVSVKGQPKHLEFKFDFSGKAVSMKIKDEYIREQIKT